MNSIMKYLILWILLWGFIFIMGYFTFPNQEIEWGKVQFSYEDATQVAESLRN